LIYFDRLFFAGFSRRHFRAPLSPPVFASIFFISPPLSRHWYAGQLHCHIFSHAADISRLSAFLAAISPDGFRIIDAIGHCIEFRSIIYTPLLWYFIIFASFSFDTLMITILHISPLPFRIFIISASFAITFIIFISWSFLRNTSFEAFFTPYFSFSSSLRRYAIDFLSFRYFFDIFSLFHVAFRH
jgi:hypothetical protein